jgi:hypothetical protein
MRQWTQPGFARPILEESVTCKVHGEDFIETLVDGQYTSHIDTATGRYAAA